MVVIASFLVFMTILFLLRVYSRISYASKYGPDDYLFIAAFVSNLTIKRPVCRLKL